MPETKYIGMTIGPISDTLAEASTPAALWFASSIFSDITRRLCRAICGSEGFANVRLLSPYYTEDIRMDDGIGKFHDRIIFSTDGYDSEKMKAITAKVKHDTETNFQYAGQTLSGGDIRQFLDSYLQIHYVVLDAAAIDGNSILALSPYLDALELMQTFPADNGKNPIRSLLAGKGNGSNEFIKKSPLFLTVRKDKNQLRNSSGNIRTIEDIAGDEKPYFAVVQADGDGMGTFLSGLDDAHVTRFSKACLDYAGEAAECIGGFGGMTIYAGGDDLLFLAPVKNGTGKTVFELCHELAALFDRRMAGAFPENPHIPTMSFGISIQYEKYPLYEALSNARRLLFGIAKEHVYKKQAKAAKNSMAVEVQKHSGQTLGLIVSNNSYPVLASVLKLGIGYANEEETVNSVIYTLHTFKVLLDVLNREAKAGCISREAYGKAWMNLFDNAGQKAAENYLKDICYIWYDHMLANAAAIEALTSEQDTLIYLLRLKKFLVERGGEER